MSGPSIKPSDAHAMALAGELVLVDVRTPKEWLETGIPASAHSITMHQDPNSFLSELLAKMDGDRTRRLAIICRTGARTTMLQGQLLQIGFTDVLNVTEGMLGSVAGPGWRQTGLPTRTPDEPVLTTVASGKA